MPQGRKRVRNEGDLCEQCEENEVRFKGYAPSGNPRWDRICTSCHRSNYVKPWQKFRGDSCEVCGLTPFFPNWALDVHHRDEDKTNNDPENLMTLCASCHRELHGWIHETGDTGQAEKMLRKFIKALLN